MAMVGYLVESHVLFDLLILHLNLWVLWRKLTQFNEIIETPLYLRQPADRMWEALYRKLRTHLLRFALVNKIIWCLWDEWYHETHQYSWNDFYARGYPPLRVIMANSHMVPQADTVVDEENQQKTKQDHQVICSVIDPPMDFGGFSVRKCSLSIKLALTPIPLTIGRQAGHHSGQSFA